MQRWVERYVVDLTCALLLITGLIGVYSLTYEGILQSGDEHLFVSGAQSLGSVGVLTTGPVYPARPGDTFVEPAQAVVGALFYQLTRLPYVGGVQVLFLVNIYLTALTAGMVYALSRHYQLPRATAVGGALLFGLGTLAWPHTKFYFRDPLAMFWVSLAVWSYELALTRQRRWAQVAQWLLTGILLAAGVMSKQTVLFILPALGLSLLLRVGTNPAERDAGRLGLGVLFVAGSVALGLSSVFLPERFSWLTYWGFIQNLGYEFKTTSLVEPMLGLLVSPGKGLLLEQPFLGLALVMLWRTPRPFWPKVWLPLFALLTLSIAIPLFRDRLWWGGVGWGVRHLLLVAPLLVVASLPVIHQLWNAQSVGIRWGFRLLCLVSIVIQLGAVTAPLNRYYEWLSTIAPGAAWTSAIWDLRYAESVGYWRILFTGQPWAFAWVRIFTVNPLGVMGLLGGLGLTIGGALFLLYRQLSRPTANGFRGAVLLAGLAFSALPYGLLRAYYLDPAYSYERDDFWQAASAITPALQAGDAVVVRGHLQPVWSFVLNYARWSAPWFAISADVPDDAQLATIRASAAPGLAFTLNTTTLLSATLPARFKRVWLINDYNAPGGEMRLEEWWLTQHAVPVHTTPYYSDQVQTWVSLFALTTTPVGPPQSVAFEFGGLLRLERWALLAWAEQRQFQAGDTVPVELTWRVLRPLEQDYNVGVYLLDAQGALRAQQDGPTMNGFQPIMTWPREQAIVDRHGLQLPDDLPPGDYALTLAVYDWQTNERLSAVGPLGAVPDNLILLTTLQIQ